MGFPILVRYHLYIESGPWFLLSSGHQQPWYWLWRFMLSSQNDSVYNRYSKGTACLQIQSAIRNGWWLEIPGIALLIWLAPCKYEHQMYANSWKEIIWPWFKCVAFSLMELNDYVKSGFCGSLALNRWWRYHWKHWWRKFLTWGSIS